MGRWWKLFDRRAAGGISPRFCKRRVQSPASDVEIEEENVFMRAVFMREPGNIEFKDAPMPEMGDSDVLLKVEYVGLCGSDLSAYCGRNPMMQFPNVPGHEIAARIADKGGFVPVGFSVGDLVLVRPYFSCGKCSSCRDNRPNACEFNQTMGTHRGGAICDYIIVPYSHAIVCNDIDPQIAALVEPLSVGAHMVNRAGVNAGDNIAVFGCGAVGLGAIATAAYRNAKVFAVDISAGKLEMAKKMGAAELINSAQANAVHVLKDLTNGDGADVTLECSGAPGAFNQALEAVRFSGKMGVVSYTVSDTTFNTKLLVAKELNLYGSRNAVGEDFETVLQMVRGGGLPVHKMITHVFAFDEAKNVFEQWKADPARITKILIKL